MSGLKPQPLPLEDLWGGCDASHTLQESGPALGYVYCSWVFPLPFFFCHFVGFFWLVWCLVLFCDKWHKYSIALWSYICFLRPDISYLAVESSFLRELCLHRPLAGSWCCQLGLPGCPRTRGQSGDIPWRDARHSTSDNSQHVESLWIYIKLLEVTASVLQLCTKWGECFRQERCCCLPLRSVFGQNGKTRYLQAIGIWLHCPETPYKVLSVWGKETL